MYVEWWMGLVFLAWWYISIHHIVSAARRSYFEDGVNQGAESTLKVLEKQGIIRIEGENISPGQKS